VRFAFTSLFAVGLALALPVGRATAQDGPSKDAAPKTTDADKLIADLGADDCNKRDDAQKKLEAMGKKILPALEKAEKESQDAEVRARAHEAILAIKKSSDSEGAPKDQEREGPPLPPERRLAPRAQGPDEDQGEDLDSIFKMFEGQQNPMMKQLPKIFERIQKQMQGMDDQYQKELRRSGDNNGGVRVFQFTSRPKTPVERRLGLALDPPPPALQAQLDLSPTDGGLLVEELAPNGPAWKAGLKLYDVILSLDGKAVRGPEDLKALGAADGKLEILRKAKKETLVVHAQTDDAPAPPTTPAPEKKDEPQIRKF
jgi:hypothetical protein